jgi:hypothetical protein
MKFLLISTGLPVLVLVEAILWTIFYTFFVNGFSNSYEPLQTLAALESVQEAKWYSVFTRKMALSFEHFRYSSAPLQQR